MSESPAAATIRPLGPAGVPCVGEPPVPLRTVARALDRARGDLAAAARALPGLGPAELEAARREVELRPESLDPRPGPGALLGLAIPLGIGAWLLAPAGWFLFALLLTLVVRPPGGGGLAGGEVARALAVAAVCALPGVGLWRLSPLARTAVVTLGIGLPFLAAVGDLRLAIGAAVLVTFPVLFLLLPVCRRWFEPAGRATVGGLSWRPCAAGAAGLATFAILTGVAVSALRALYESLGLDLPWITQLVLEAHQVVENYPFLAVPAVVLLPLPLLLVPHRHEPAAFWGAITASGAGVCFVFMALWAPIQALQEKL